MVAAPKGLSRGKSVRISDKLLKIVWAAVDAAGRLRFSLEVTPRMRSMASGLRYRVSTGRLRAHYRTDEPIFPVGHRRR